MNKKIISLILSFTMVSSLTFPILADTNNKLETNLQNNNSKYTIEIPSKQYYNHTEFIGVDRYETALKIAQESGKTDRLIIVNGSNHIYDALSAAPLSGKLDASIIPINPDKISSKTINFINNADEVYIIGMYNAIPKDFESSLKVNRIVRIGGKDRFETSEKIASYLGKYDTAYLVNGFEGIADAISISPVAARDINPIILTRKDKYPDKIFNDIHYIIIGGNKRISYENQKKMNAERIAGSDRYETNKLILDKFYSNKDYISFCNGETLIDALSGANYSKDFGIALINRNKNHNLLDYINTIQLGGLPFDVDFVYTSDGNIPSTPNNPPTTPEAIADITDNYNDDDKALVNINITKESTDPDGNSITYEWKGKSPNNYYTVGEHTVQLRAVDDKGLASEWFDINFFVTEKPSETLNMMVTGNKFQELIKTLNIDENIDSIEFSDSIPENIDTIDRKVDVSLDNDKSVIAFIENNKMIIAANGKVVANPNSSYMFAGGDENGEYFPLININSINFENFDSSKIEDASFMFTAFGSLHYEKVSLDMSNFDTSNIKDMKFMFYATNPKNFENFDTSNVIDMSYMFAISKIETFNLSSWNTRNLRSASHMFNFCHSVSDIYGLENWKTDNLEDVSYMFGACNNLTAIDISEWNTSNIKNMEGMFFLCVSLGNIGDLSNWNTSNVTNMSSLFYNCNILENIGNLKWDIRNTNDLHNMFKYCHNMKSSIIISNPNLDSEEIAGMFNSCSDASGSEFIVNYIPGCREIAEKIVNTKSPESNIILGTEII